MMEELKVDVLIVGAGPAGSTAAKELAKKGIDVLIIDKKQEIGTPKRCAEGVSAAGLKRMGIDPDDRWAFPIYGAKLYSPSGKVIEMKGEGMRGYVLERKLFEKELASEAINAGAKYLVKTLAIGMKRDEIAKVKAERMGKELSIEAKIVMGADGVESKIGRWAGMNIMNRLIDYHSCFQYEMAGVNIDRKFVHLFFGNELAPKGYGWIFPKGERANVGLGILGKKSGKKRAINYLDEFIDSHPKIFANASAIEMNAGGVPVAPSKEMATDNVILIGDAAKTVTPMHGGGIILAMESAKMASRIVVDAIEERNYSAGTLKKYEEEWEKAYGKKMGKFLKLRSFLEKLEDKDFERLANILEGEDVFKLTQAKFGFFIKKLLTKAPSMIPLVKKFLIG